MSKEKNKLWRYQGLIYTLIVFWIGLIIGVLVF